MKNEIEVLALKETSNPSVPNIVDRATFTSINPALKLAKKWAQIHYRVEVSDALIDEDGFIEQDEWIACWEKGVKTL